MLQLRDIFGADGPLRRALPGFVLRTEQLHMAERVARALEARETLVIEAGTGIGKTFAYLVPALLSGLRVLVSTGTRALQDQLYAKDLPLVGAAIGRPARVALLKGRANYLCRHRLERALDARAMLDSARREPWLARIERWARTTRRGDLAEVAGFPDTHPLWLELTSTRENCLGSGCAEFTRCHVAAARREAQEADLVIVNHHLLLADLLLKEDGFADILGSADALVLDEAHQLPDLATQFFGASVGSRRVGHLLGALREELAGRSCAQVSAALEPVEALLGAVGSALPPRVGRHAWEECDASLGRCCAELGAAVGALGGALTSAGESAWAALGARASELAAQIARVAAVDELEGARSAEVSARGFTLHFLPFDVSQRFKALIESRRAAWIFTSATLSIGEDFSHFTGRLGLAELGGPAVKIASPFDYASQSLLYVPRGLPPPSAPGYVGAMLEAALPLIEAARGGAFVLFTSHRALAEGSQLLRQRWAADAPYRLYVQGEAPREQLLQGFRADGDGVLLGTASFWEGVDVKGAALRLVIIEKLPFAAPDDPLVKARVDHIRDRGGNPFRDFQLPQAALALKQGVGRLIRSESDFGVVAICDRRLLERSYGSVLIAALPPMPLTRDEAQAAQFLRTHAAPPDCERRAAAGVPMGR
jgi:ATP-dependent DNA helicase DinG